MLVSRQELWPSFLEDRYGVVIGLGSKLHEIIDAPVPDELSNQSDWHSVNN